MPLPILKSQRLESDADLIRLFHRTELHWTRHFGDETVLSAGAAFVQPDLPRIAAANRVLDAALPEGSTVAEVIREVDEHFGLNNARCLQWLLSPTASAQPLADHFTAAAWEKRCNEILHLNRASLASVDAGELTIIPARASHRHARLLAEESARECGESQVADAAMVHLDDPHWDALLALRGANVAGTIGVLSVGDIGRIDALYVHPAFRRRGVATALLGRALESCGRSVFRHVMLSVEPENVAAHSLFTTAGFRSIGKTTAFQPPRTSPATPP
jgi:ribosomal protein S18 acetylase RimI-like enzyme